MNWTILAAVAIPVAGWLVTHFSQISAQRRHLRLQILNDARLQVTELIRDYQSWLSEVSASVRAPHILFETGSASAIDWGGRYREWDQMRFDPRSGAWLAGLEEYDALFPEARETRKALALRRKVLLDDVGALRDTLGRFLYANDPPALKAVLDPLPGLATRLLDEAALMDDLRRHLQTRALKEITGHEAEPRRPTDPTAPRLELDRKGRLFLGSPSERDSPETEVNERAGNAASRLARLWLSPAGRITRLSFLGYFLLPLVLFGSAAAGIDALLEAPTQQSVIQELVDDGFSDDEIFARLRNDPDFRALDREAPGGMGQLASAASLLSFIIGGIGAIKRFHDFNVSGWVVGAFAVSLGVGVLLSVVDAGFDAVDLMPAASFLLFRILPPVLVVYVIALLVIPGTKGPNKYGPRPAL